MTELIFISLILLHSSAIALGVGSSTIAIAGFLTAIGDGTFDPSERRIMGVVYLSLRIAMISIVIISALIWLMDANFFGTFTMPMWVMTAILFVNAYLMTKHWISPKIGPAIQAGTWYTLGFVITIYVFDLAPITPILFFVFYIIDLVLAIAIVNGCMKYLKWRRTRATPQVQG